MDRLLLQFKCHFLKHCGIVCKFLFSLILFKVVTPHSVYLVNHRSTASLDYRQNIVTGNMTSIPPKWIPDSAWKQCQFLSAKEDAYEGLCMYILNCKDQWKEFSKHDDPFEMMAKPFKGQYATGRLTGK